jgi:hypothetical protein
MEKTRRRPDRYVMEFHRNKQVFAPGLALLVAAAVSGFVASDEPYWHTENVGIRVTAKEAFVVERDPKLRGKLATRARAHCPPTSADRACAAW